MMADGILPGDLGRAALIEISLPSLVAGTRYRGEFVGAVLLAKAELLLLRGSGGRFRV